MEAIRLVAVTKDFTYGCNYVRVLENVSFSIEEQGFVVIMGPSGSGKSTLLNLIGGLDRPTSGEVFIKNVSLAEFTDDEMVEYRRRNIGFVFQKYNLISVLNVFENIVLPVKLDGMQVNKVFAQEIAEALGIGDKLLQMPENLSGGQQQRVAIARAIFAKPTVLLADEPTGNLDTKTSIEVMNLLKKLSRTFCQTMIIVTHDSRIADMADRVIEIEDGKVCENKSEANTR